MSSNQKQELEKFPKIKDAYLRAFDRMLQARREAGLNMQWNTAEEVMEWWTK